MTYNHSASLKLDFLDRQFPSSGTYGYLAILDNFLLSSAPFSVNATDDELLFSMENKLVTGSRVRLTSTQTLPGGLLSNTDYFIIRVSSTSVKLASTIADAQSGIAVNITDAGSGDLRLSEQQLSAEDSIEALIAHELSPSSAYTARFEISDLGLATIVGNEAQKAPWISLLTNTTSSTIESSHRLVIKGGSATIGDTSSSLFSVHTEALTIYAGETKSFSVVFARSS